MHYINRSLAVVTVKQGFVDWLRGLGTGEDFSLEECNRSKTAILLPDFDDETQAERYIRENWEDIVRHEVVMRLADQSRMPEGMDYDRFCDWFGVEITGDVYDMMEDEIDREMV
ncbi:hypothetical protein STSP2_00931 [Anaerohalosphaera lusitana]|uniref:Uncharacterized protein n=1 Tax=Anaerohalosphaera lusitana TaxID=1936003 RepID=A0A1U9NIL7_9BACT|nr:hypothetical protein [Anaerohalosphaera lusitana]AQT67782.1 hypothetical protein STSP2_00931 [Anaerohalosphaera lusitana]